MKRYKKVILLSVLLFGAKSLLAHSGHGLEMQPNLFHYLYELVHLIPFLIAVTAVVYLFARLRRENG